MSADMPLVGPPGDSAVNPRGVDWIESRARDERVATHLRACRCQDCCAEARTEHDYAGQ